MADLVRVVSRPLTPSVLVDSTGGDAARSFTDSVGLTDVAAGETDTLTGLYSDTYSDTY